MLSSSADYNHQVPVKLFIEKLQRQWKPSEISRNNRSHTAGENKDEKVDDDEDEDVDMYEDSHSDEDANDDEHDEMMTRNDAALSILSSLGKMVAVPPDLQKVRETNRQRSRDIDIKIGRASESNKIP